MNEYGDDFVVLTDEDGKEYELEILATVEYQDATYKALIPADSAENDDDEPLEVTILKVVEEDGEEFLVTLDDEDEEEAVYELFLEQDELFDEEDNE